MAVIVKYVVERNGVEKMTFTSKKDADAYDKMLDIADALSELFTESPVELNEQMTEELSLYLAQNASQFQQVLKGGKVQKQEKTPAKELKSAAKKKAA